MSERSETKQKHTPLKVVRRGSDGYCDIGDGRYSPVAENVDGDYADLFAAAPEMADALKACLAYIPGSEVRSWPPGFQLKREALKKARAALAKAGVTP